MPTFQAGLFYWLCGAIWHCARQRLSEPMSKNLSFRRKTNKFPEEIGYLFELIKSLHSIDLEFEAEDLDTSNIEACLRARISNLSVEMAKKLLHNDTKLLKGWSKSNELDAVHWLIAFMDNDELAEYLQRPVHDAPKTLFPDVKYIPVKFTGKVPDGWNQVKVKNSLVFLNCKPGYDLESAVAVIHATSVKELEMLEKYYLGQNSLYGDSSFFIFMQADSTKNLRVFKGKQETLYLAYFEGFGIEALCGGSDINKTIFLKLISSVHPKDLKQDKKSCSNLNALGSSF